MSEVAEDLQAWEPRTFKIGDRVRVKLSPECRAKGKDFRSDGAVFLLSGHRVQEDGRTGTVAVPPPYFRTSRSHPIAVQFDESFIADDMRHVGAGYAVTELEPLDEVSNA